MGHEESFASSERIPLEQNEVCRGIFMSLNTVLFISSFIVLAIQIILAEWMPQLCSSALSQFTWAINWLNGAHLHTLPCDEWIGKFQCTSFDVFCMWNNFRKATLVHWFCGCQPEHRHKCIVDFNPFTQSFKHTILIHTMIVVSFNCRVVIPKWGTTLLWDISDWS